MLNEPPGLARHVHLDFKGIWVAGSEDAVSYPEDGNDTCYALEDDSFWFRHRNEVVVGVMRRFPPAGMLFDVGGGNGFVAAGIERAGWPAVVVEPGRGGAENARARGLDRVIQGTTENAGFAPGSMPAVGLFDVLEHVEDDVRFLKSLRGLLRPEGRLYLAVPAHRWLWSNEDRVAGHYHRYTRRSLAAVLRSAGFRIEFQTYFFGCLPPLIFLLRTLPSWLGWRSSHSSRSNRREHAGGRGIVGRWLERTLQRERSSLDRGRVLPMGSSCFAVACNSEP